MITVKVCSFTLEIFSQARTIKKYPIVYFSTEITLSKLTQAIFSSGSIIDESCSFYYVFLKCCKSSNTDLIRNNSE